MNLVRPIARTLYCAALLVLPASASLAAAPSPDQDLPGYDDLPQIARFADSTMYDAGQESLGKASIVDAKNGRPRLRNLEGRIGSRVYYVANAHSPLEVYRVYQQALKAAGYQVNFSCEDPKCQAQGVQAMVQEMPRTAFWDGGFDAITSSMFDSANRPKFHYVSAHKPGPGGDVFVQVAVSVGNGARTQQFVQVIEASAGGADK